MQFVFSGFLRFEYIARIHTRVNTTGNRYSFGQINFRLQDIGCDFFSFKL